jgi:hypothetical protein
MPAQLPSQQICCYSPWFVFQSRHAAGPYFVSTRLSTVVQRSRTRFVFNHMRAKQRDFSDLRKCETQNYGRGLRKSIGAPAKPLRRIRTTELRQIAQ